MLVNYWGKVDSMLGSKLLWTTKGFTYFFTILSVFVVGGAMALWLVC